MGRIFLLAVLLSALAAAGIVAAGGVELDPKQAAELARKDALPPPIPKETDLVPPAPVLRRVVARRQGRVGATVVMDRLHFGAERVEVRAGQSVRWVNRDRVAHKLLADDAVGAGSRPTFDSETIAPGEAFRATLRSPGLLRYVCVLHPTSMVAYVVVEKR